MPQLPDGRQQPEANVRCVDTHGCIEIFVRRAEPGKRNPPHHIYILRTIATDTLVQREPRQSELVKEVQDQQ